MKGKRSLILIDVVGAAVVVGLVVAGVWFGVLNVDSTLGRINRISVQTKALGGCLTAVRVDLARQEEQVRRREAELAQKGRLPRRTPVERELRAINAMSVANGLTFNEVAPLAATRYGDLLEQRCVLTGTGSFRDLLQFLQDVERGPFWVDITHVKITPAARRQRPQDPRRQAVFTVGFYSAAEDAADGQTEAPSG